MNKSYVKQFGKNLQKIRKDKKMTQDDLGTNGVSRSMISLIEIGRTDVTISKLKIIADNLGVEVKELFNF